MAKDPSFTGAQKGDRLTGRNINQWIGNAMDAFGRSGKQPGTGTLIEPAFTADVANMSDTDIEARHPVWIGDATETDVAGVLNKRAFNAYPVSDLEHTATIAAIAVDRIPHGGAGKVYLVGVCAALMTDADATLLMSGGADVIWSSDDLDTNSERWSVVRIGGQPRARVIQIIGGQTSNGVPVIQYAADPFTPDKFYDAEVDTVYISGLGNGWMLDYNGTQQRKVLVRHSYLGQNANLMQGFIYQAWKRVTLSYGGNDFFAWTPTFAAL